MYNEFKDRNREAWKFSYKGYELSQAATKKVAFYKAEEEKFRTKMTEALADRSIAVNSGRVDKAKRRLEAAAVQAENCEVFLHEFKRTPDREFQLSMADVVFFGLAGHSIAVEEDND